jgi:hypothetical protein
LKLDQKRWNERFKGRKFACGKKANPFLKKQIALLPQKGKVLDIAGKDKKGQISDVDSLHSM